MKVIAFDTETELFRPGTPCPRLVCLSFQFDFVGPWLRHQSNSYYHLQGWLSEPDTLLVGAHVAYDIGVLCQAFPELTPAFFKLYDENRVTDVLIRQKLLDIAAGQYRGRMVDGNVWLPFEYNLERLTKRLTGRQLDKDTWRLRYGELIDTPLDQWPDEARQYPKEDARATWDCYHAQEPHAKDFLEDQFRQTRRALWLAFCSNWGLRTDGAKVSRYAEQVAAERDELKAELIERGLVRADGSRDTKAAKAHMVKVCSDLGIPVRLTKKDGVSLDKDACHQTGDLLLESYADYTTLGHALNNSIPALQAGTVYPIHTRFDMAESGRTTSSAPNVQNWGRKPGPRECFVPRPGMVFASADYEQLELHTLAQVCMTLFGHSKLAEALNSGRDPHSELAASILGRTYEDVLAHRKDPEVDNARQTAKVANFGFPGGLGAPKLVLFARKTYKVDISPSRAAQLKEEWQTQWPEMREFFAYVGRLTENESGLAWVRQHGSNRLRGACHFCAACNTLFQGLGADATGLAGWAICKACYVDTASPLHGSRMVNYVHDDFLLETPDTPAAHDVATELARVMVVEANRFLPDVPTKTEPLLMRYWSKEAQPIFDENRRLVPWDGQTK